jgi:DNA-binding helix-hairpin-helix protein with protein kinase domain
VRSPATRVAPSQRVKGAAPSSPTATPLPESARGYKARIVTEIEARASLACGAEFHVEVERVETGSGSDRRIVLWAEDETAWRELLAWAEEWGVDLSAAGPRWEGA